MAYATYEDVETRLGVTFTETEQGICNSLLNLAAAEIDSYTTSTATDEIKKIVSVESVARAMNVASDVPMGASQGSMSALGYSQSWTMPTGGSVGSIYLSKAEKKLLGIGNAIGASNPLSFITRELV